MQPPANWKELTRHPLSAAHPDIQETGAACMESGMKDHGYLACLPITIHEGQVIDGWQRLSRCISLGITPTFQALPVEWAPEEYVRAVNEGRRHHDYHAVVSEAEMRRKRIEEARAVETPPSMRVLAEAEGVSATTILRDIEKIEAEKAGSVVTVLQPSEGSETEQPEVPAPPRQVVGRNGHNYAAQKKPNPDRVCERCHRINNGIPLPHCASCIDLRRDKRTRTTRKKNKTSPDPDGKKDAFGNAVPKLLCDKLFDPWFLEAAELLSCVLDDLLVAKLADGMLKRADLYPFYTHNKDFVDGVGFVQHYVEQLIKYLKENLLEGVCPMCQGEKCAHCLQSGLVPRAVYETLKKEAPEEQIEMEAEPTEGVEA